MSNLLIAVSAYAGDQHQVESNLPCYRHHNVSVLILSPEDAPIQQLAGDPRGVYYSFAGKAQWAGPDSLVRHKRFLEMMLAAPYDRYIFHDADSVCLSSNIPEYVWSSEILWSNEVPDTNPSPSLLPKLALQPPYALTRRVLQRLVEAADRPATSYTSQETPDDWPLPIPTGCIDHYMLQIAHAAGVEHRSFLDGASWETGSDIGLREMTRKVRDDGIVFIHQVKSASVLLTLLGAHEIFKKNHGR